MLLPINNPSFFCPGIATRNLRMGTISRIRNRRFPRQLSPHGGDPFGVNAQRFGHRVVDLSSHGVFVHQGKGLQGFALQPVNQLLRSSSSVAPNVAKSGTGGTAACPARRTGMTACGCRVRPAETTGRGGVQVEAQGLGYIRVVGVARRPDRTDGLFRKHHCGNSRQRKP